MKVAFSKRPNPYIRGPVTLYRGDCLEILPTLEAGSVDAVVTDPPYGMHKAEWDMSIPQWLPLVKGLPIATFCGVIGMRDYPPADWTGAWVRQGSTQRNGRLRGFNNWEPILFYNVDALLNDVICTPNFHKDFGHPTTKPEPLMIRLVELMDADTILDPFTGSGTTAIACIRTGRKFIGCEIDPKYWELACRRIDKELNNPGMVPPKYTHPKLKSFGVTVANESRKKRRKS